MEIKYWESNVGENFKKGVVNRAKNYRQVVELMRIPRPEGVGKASILVSALRHDSLTSSVIHAGGGPKNMGLEGPQGCSQLTPMQLRREIFYHFLSSRMREAFLRSSCSALGF